MLAHQGDDTTFSVSSLEQSLRQTWDQLGTSLPEPLKEPVANCVEEDLAFCA